MARKKTVGTGGSISRDLARRKIRRMREAINRNHEASDEIYGYERALDEFEKWLNAQPKRLRKKGGLGRA